MAIQTCPTTIVRTPADRVWRLLTTPSELERWSGTWMLKGPDRPLAAGDQLSLAAGLFGSVRVVFQVLAVEPPRRLALEVRLPLGIINHEILIITRISDSECRVTYN